MPSLVEPVIVAGTLSAGRQPVVRHGKLVLRAWEQADHAAVMEAYTDADIQRWHARSMTSLEAGEWIGSWSTRWEQETGASWAVTDGSQVLQTSPATTPLTTATQQAHPPRFRAHGGSLDEPPRRWVPAGMQVGAAL